MELKRKELLITSHEIAKAIIQASEEDKTIKQVLQEKGLLTEEIINAIYPTGMV